MVAHHAAPQLASRIDTGLRQLLGEGIDPSRLLLDALYRRDVLLVCDACAPGDLATLAGQLRHALADAPHGAASARRALRQQELEHDHDHDSHEDAALPRASSGPDSGGFSPSRFFNSLFGAWTGLGNGDAGNSRHHSKAGQRRGWFGR